MSTIIAADMLTAMRGLPLTALISVGLLGAGLIVTGWWLHRFWATLATTFAAGLMGLRVGPDYGMQPIVAGILAAVAAGCMALALVRVALFVGCGLAAWTLAQASMPKEPTPIIALAVGGMLGMFMYRFWIIAVTSAAGVLFIVYNFLILLEKATTFDAVQWTAAHASLINSLVGGAVLGGILLQYWIDKFRGKLASWSAGWQSQPSKSGGESKGLLSWFKRAA